MHLFDKICQFSGTLIGLIAYIPKSSKKVYQPLDIFGHAF